MGAPQGGPRQPRGFMTEEEKAAAPKFTLKLFKRILGYLKPYWLLFVFVFIAIIISSVLGLLPSMITGRIIDEAITGRNMSYLIQLILAAFATLVASRAISVLETYINAYISQKIIYDMKNEMYHHLEYMPHSFFTTEKQGDILTRMESDISGVSSVISGTLTSTISSICTVATTMIALFAMSWQLALVGLAVLPILIFPTRQVGKVRWKLLGENQLKKDALNQHINETLSVSGSLLVKLFAREEYEYGRFCQYNDEVTKVSLKEQRSGQWFRALMGILMQAGPLLIYFAGGYFIIGNIDTTLTVGTITATVALVNRVYRPVETLIDLQVSLTRSLALFSRIFDYLDRENPITDSPAAQQPPIKNKDVEFKNVEFEYTPGAKVLHDISFTVPGGKMYAVVGPSGSGKSTLVNLIPRLYDVTGGSVSIGGVDVRDIQLQYLRGQIGVVTQEAYLSNGSIRDNLLYAKPAATEAEMISACKAANIYDFISSTPDGLDTLVGNRGLKLSGGEKQRVSLARTVLKNPDILILDEATSALDSISENAIQDALDIVMKGRTSIVIAHRLSTVLAADCIIVISEGRVVQQGGHDELLAQGGLYKELYETQFKRILERE